MPQYMHALACKFSFKMFTQVRLSGMLKQLRRSNEKSHVCYSCADRVSVWQPEKMYSIAKNLLDASRMDSSFWQGFCNCSYCVCQVFLRRLSKEAVYQFKWACILEQNSWTPYSLSSLSGLVALAPTTLQGQRSARYSITAAGVSDGNLFSWDPHSVNVQLELFH